MLILNSPYRQFVLSRTFIAHMMIVWAARRIKITHPWDRHLLDALAQDRDIVWC